MTSHGSFKRGVRRQARETGQRYTQVLAEMHAGHEKPAPASIDAPPLPVLLAHVLLDLTRAFHVAVGERIRDAHGRIVAMVTDDWRDRYGPDLATGLTASLAEVEEQLSDDLPDHVVVQYTAGRGFADTSFAVTK